MTTTATISHTAPATTPRVAAFQHAAYSRDPLRLPGAPSVTTVEGRRWRDLHLAYARQLGARVGDESVRVLLGALISHTLLLERLQAAVARGDPVEPNNLIQGTQTVMRLLSELGLKAAQSRDVASDLVSYLRNGEPAP